MSPRRTKENPLGLEPVDGEAVTELGIEIPGAAGGFREPLDVDESLIHMLAPVQVGDTVFCVLQLTKHKVRFQPAKNHDGLKRVDIFRVDGSAIVDADMAEGAVQEQRTRVQEKLDELAQQGTMVGRDGEAKSQKEPHLSAVEDGAS